VIHHLTGLPYSFTPHANDLYRSPALFEEKVRDAEFVVTISEYDKRYIRERVTAPARIEVVHHGIDLDQFEPRDVGGDGNRRVTCVASFTPKKGHRDLLQAFASLLPDFPDLELELVGDGEERDRIEAQIESLGIADRVKLPGWLPPDQVHDRLAGTEVFALPSIPLASGRMDGIPNALKEAMASGVPVVSTPLSGIPELVKDGVNGLLVPPGDWQALAGAMRRLLEDQEFARRLAERGREHVLEQFDLDVEANKLGDLIVGVHA
jgi:glycosyltransferase involved in cell wall biosynthesis